MWLVEEIMDSNLFQEESFDIQMGKQFDSISK